MREQVRAARTRLYCEFESIDCMVPRDRIELSTPAFSGHCFPYNRAISLALCCTKLTWITERTTKSTNPMASARDIQTSPGASLADNAKHNVSQGVIRKDRH